MDLDNSMNSGMTGMGCVRFERDFLGMEIEKRYYDMAIERLKRES